jgi:hypothetical protein
MIEEQLSLPYSIRQFLHFEGSEEAKNEEILSWAKKNDLTVLDSKGFVVVKLPNLVGGIRALFSMPNIDSPILLFPNEPYNILDLTSLLELPQRFLIPIIPLDQIKLRSLCKIMHCLNSGEVSDVFFDTKRSRAQSSNIRFFKKLPSPQAVLPSMNFLDWDDATWCLIKTPLLFAHFHLSAPVSKNVSWLQLLDALPTEALQSIGFLLIRMGFIEEVNELKILPLGTQPKRALAAICCYGYLAVWNNREKALYYKEFLEILGFPIDQTAFFEASFKDPSSESAEFISVVGAAHLLETIANSEVLDDEAFVQKWIHVILNTTQTKDFHQRILLGTLCHLHHFAKISPKILIASIHFLYPDFHILKQPSCDFYLDFIEDNPSLLSSILIGSSFNLYETAWAPIIQLRLTRIATISGQFSLRRQLLENYLPKDGNKTNVQQYIRIGGFLSKARAFSKANELYASVPDKLKNDTILSDRILNHLCQFQLRQAASLLETPLASKIRLESREFLTIRLLRSQEKLSDAEHRATSFLKASNSPKDPASVILELAQIQGATERYDASIETLQSLNPQGMANRWLEIMEFETQLQRWCRDGTLHSDHTSLPHDQHYTRQKEPRIDLRTLLSLALSTANSESLAQECFRGYVYWDLLYSSHQHWFLLCGIALALRTKNKSLASNYLKTWQQDPWIYGRRRVLGDFMTEIDIGNPENKVFWKNLLRSWSPEVPALQRWSELLSTIVTGPNHF